MADGDRDYDATNVSVDLAFTDGTYLSDLEARRPARLRAVAAGRRARPRSLYVNQWNNVVSRIGSVAAGKTVDRILVAYDSPKGPAKFRGWLDDVSPEASGTGEAEGASVRLRAHHPRHQLQRRLLARQQLPGDRRAARLQLLDAGDQRVLAELAVRLRARPTTTTTCRRSRRSARATSRARGWATGRPSR